MKAELKLKAMEAVRAAARLRAEARWDPDNALSRLSVYCGVEPSGYLPRMGMDTNLLVYTEEKYRLALHRAFFAVLEWMHASSEEEDSAYADAAPPHVVKHFWCRGEGCEHCNYLGVQVFT